MRSGNKRSIAPFGVVSLCTQVTRTDFVASCRFSQEARTSAKSWSLDGDPCWATALPDVTTVMTPTANAVRITHCVPVSELIPDSHSRGYHAVMANFDRYLEGLIVGVPTREPHP